jgi:phosphatidate phosphatase PAH1
MSAPLAKSFFDHALRQRLVAASVLAFVVACAGTPAKSEPPPSVPSLPSPSAPSPPADAAKAFRHPRSRAVVALGVANHRARDVLAVAGDAVAVEAKIAYGTADKDLADEDVRIEREATGGSWSTMGIARTDHDGRIRWSAGTLPLGSHRLRVTVIGDGTSTELSVVVVPGGQSIFVSDVDGTLTESETAEFPALMKRKLPDVHPSAAEAFRKLASKGLVPVYLTARPDWLIPRTREFLATNQFPPGVVVTERNTTGRFGSGAAAFKKQELEALVANGRTKIEWAFGNMPSDAETYAQFVGDPKRRVFYRYADTAHGGRRIESYAELLGELSP